MGNTVEIVDGSVQGVDDPDVLSLGRSMSPAFFGENGMIGVAASNPIADGGLTKVVHLDFDIMGRINPDGVTGICKLPHLDCTSGTRGFLSRGHQIPDQQGFGCR
jgi:hypothetical protein